MELANLVLGGFSQYCAESNNTFTLERVYLPKNLKVVQKELLMNKKSYILQSNRLLSTDLIKAIAIIFIIINHTINDKVIDKSVINKQYYLLFWVYQAVSLFVVITGIHYSKSMENLINIHYSENDCWETGILGWYKIKQFIKKMGRLWIPYTIEQIIWFISYRCMGKSVGKFFYRYISGGVGPGGYYTVCMIQIIAIFPVLYYVIKKYNIMGVLSIVAINMLYEFMVKYGWIADSFNRLCSIRLFTGLALGIVIYLYFQKIKDTAIPWIWLVLGVVAMWNAGGGIIFKLLQVNGFHHVL